MIIITANAVKLNLTELTTRSDHGQLSPVFLSYLLHLLHLAVKHFYQCSRKKEHFVFNV